MNHADRHTHMHRSESSELKWEKFQILHDHFPLLPQVSQEDGFLQETAGILTPSLKAYRWEPLDNTSPKYKKKLLISLKNLKKCTT